MVKTQDEKTLFIKISEGDEQSFALLFNAYIPQLESFVLKYTKSFEATQEVIQNAFIRLWLNRDKLTAVENPKAYVYKFVANECFSYLRKALRNDQVRDAFGKSQAESTNSTLESLYVRDIRSVIAATLQRMPEKRRQIYELSRMQGKNIREIAENLGLSPNTVKNTLVTALKTIREALEKHGIAVSMLIIMSVFKLK